MRLEIKISAFWGSWGVARPCRWPCHSPLPGPTIKPNFSHLSTWHGRAIGRAVLPCPDGPKSNISALDTWHGRAIGRAILCCPDWGWHGRAVGRAVFPCPERNTARPCGSPCREGAARAISWHGRAVCHMASPDWLAGGGTSAFRRPVPGPEVPSALKSLSSLFLPHFLLLPHSFFFLLPPNFT